MLRIMTFDHDEILALGDLHVLGDHVKLRHQTFSEAGLQDWQTGSIQAESLKERTLKKPGFCS